MCSFIILHFFIFFYLLQKKKHRYRENIRHQTFSVFPLYGISWTWFQYVKKCLSQYASVYITKCLSFCVCLWGTKVSGVYCSQTPEKSFIPSIHRVLWTKAINVFWVYYSCFFAFSYLHLILLSIYISIYLPIIKF